VSGNGNRDPRRKWSSSAVEEQGIWLLNWRKKNPALGCTTPRHAAIAEKLSADRDAQ
jgi:hypothetical protein